VAAGEAADRVRVAEAPAGALSPQALGDPGVRIAVVAQGVELLTAVPALPAGDEGVDHHPLADLAVAHALADLDDLAHELVAQDVAGPHERDVAADQVQVGAAAGGLADLDDDVVVVEQLRVGDRLDGDLVDAGPGGGPHRVLRSLARRAPRLVRPSL
jgi:hypothetical protein